VIEGIILHILASSDSALLLELFRTSIPNRKSFLVTIGDALLSAGFCGEKGVVADLASSL
jgi:hypothetical protein